MEHDSTLYVGLDVHKESITAAYALGMGEVDLLGNVSTTKTDIDRLCKRLQSKASRIRIVCEAGPAVTDFTVNFSRRESTAWCAHCL